MIDLAAEKAKHADRMGLVKDRTIGLELGRQLHRGVGSGIPFIRAALRRCTKPRRALDVARAELAQLVAYQADRERRRREIQMVVTQEHETQHQWFRRHLEQLEGAPVTAEWIAANFLEAGEAGIRSGGLHGWWYQVARPGLLRHGVEFAFTMRDVMQHQEREPVDQERAEENAPRERKQLEHAAKLVDVSEPPELAVQEEEEETLPDSPSDAPADAIAMASGFKSLETAQREYNRAVSRGMDRARRPREAEYFGLEGAWGWVTCRPDADGSVSIEGRIPRELADRILGEILREHYPFSVQGGGQA